MRGGTASPVYTLSVAADRRYQLQSSQANRTIDALLEQLRVPEATWRLYGDTLTTVLKMYEDGAGVANLKITSAALKELRYGFKVFAPYRARPQGDGVRLGADAAGPSRSRARRTTFGKRMAEAGWMVITGAGSGVMGAGAARRRPRAVVRPQHPAARSSRTPIPWIADDPKLITLQVLLHAQAVPRARGAGHGVLPRRLRHLRRGVRGADADPDRQGRAAPDRAAWTRRAARTGRSWSASCGTRCWRTG